MYRRIVKKRHPEHGWGTKFNWRCRMCGKVYDEQQVARYCCGTKKKLYGIVKSLTDKAVDWLFQIKC